MQTFIDLITKENPNTIQSSMVRLNLTFPPQNTGETLIQIAKDYSSEDFVQLEFKHADLITCFYYDESKNFTNKQNSFIQKTVTAIKYVESDITKSLELMSMKDTKIQMYGELKNGCYRIAKKIRIGNWILYLECECPVKNIDDAKKMKNIYFESWPVVSTPDHPIHYKIVFECLASDLDFAPLSKFFHALPSNALPRIAKALNNKHMGVTVKSLVNPVRGLTNANVGELSELPKYMISPKYDGVRALLELNDNMCYAIDSAESSFPIEGGDYMICDSEFCEGVYWIFDILFANGQCVINLPFAERYKFISQALRSPKIKIKPMYQFNELEKAFEDTSMPTDGIIFTSPNKYYDFAYKWKPASHLSVDFLIGRKNINGFPLIVGAPDWAIRKYRFIIQQLPHIRDAEFRMMKQKNSKITYFPVQFSIVGKNQFWNGRIHKESNLDEKKNYEGCVMEMIYFNEEWVAIRERIDRIPDVASNKYFGNNWQIADETFREIQNPLTKEALINLTKTAYFEIHVNQDFKVSRNINNAIKYKIYEDLKNSNYVLDLATGKGQDLKKYQTLNIQHLICVEPDEAAIVHLKSRLVNLNYTEPTVLNMGIPPNVDIDICQSTIGKHIPAVKCDAIVCSLAAHYWLKTTIAYQNFATILASWTKSGGIVFLSFFDDDVIRARPVWNESQYSVVYTPPNGKTNEEFEFGFVSVKLPFSTEIRLEALVDSTCLKNAMEQHGFEGVKKNYHEFIETWHRDATTADKEWISTYCVWKFIKK
jgi:hypothetical protein